MKLHKFKWVSILCLSLAFTACGSPKSNERITILAPKGATSLPFVQTMTDKTADVELVDGSDLLTAEFVKADGDYEVLVAPINLGAKLISEGKSTYKLAAVLTWGNLYVVGSQDIQSGDVIAAFGENAVPGKILREVMSAAGMNNEVQYYSAVTEAQAQLLSKKVTVALLAEPAATATIAKAKQDGFALKVVLDLQEAWVGNKGGKYPQAALFVKEKSYLADQKSYDALFAQISDSIVKEGGDPSALIPLIDAIGADVLGVPNSKVATQSYFKQNIQYVKATEAKQEIADFLALFQIIAEDTLYLK